MDRRKLLDDFLVSTKTWHDQFENPHDPCVFCGMIPENLLQLVEEIKEIKEKAWKYDDLSK